MLAPSGTLRVGVLMVWYFALEDKASGIGAELIKLENPGAVMAAFRNNALDITFIGITADRAEVMQYGPTVIDLQTTYVVPAGSKIASIEEIDQPGLRILVPQRSAQEAHLRKTITKTTPINVAVENPKQAVELIAAGQADAFSREVLCWPRRSHRCPARASCPAAISAFRSPSRRIVRRGAQGFGPTAVGRSWRSGCVLAHPSHCELARRAEPHIIVGAQQPSQGTRAV